MPDVGDEAEVAVDTSVAIAYLVRSHNHHAAVRHHLAGRRLCLTTHSLAETYSVLTRLPGDARVAAADASTLIEVNFARVIPLPLPLAERLHVIIAEHEISGGAVYDALVALAAREHGVPLATRDTRAASTYAALAVRVELLPG